MTKKTNDASGVAEALPASLVQPSAPVTLEHPATGGSFLRQADGSLVPNPDAATADKVDEPKCHFDSQPQGGDAVA